MLCLDTDVKYSILILNTLRTPSLTLKLFAEFTKEKTIFHRTLLKNVWSVLTRTKKKNIAMESTILQLVTNHKLNCNSVRIKHMTKPS